MLENIETEDKYLDDQMIQVKQHMVNKIGPSSEFGESQCMLDFTNKRNMGGNGILGALKANHFLILFLKNSTYLYGQAEASKNVIGGIGGSGNSGSTGGSQGIGVKQGSGDIGGSRGTGGLSTGGGVMGVTSAGTWVEDLEPKDVG
ncbi:hypothetical protein RHGRI_032897 [Rhododendron griersonianum]|uniref:Uncharacterized protein n=1 Tax=Rhododendron griersonianum TaxID=479676 RepID=A0AAV6IGV3_9ERIC|nr:hypothetical protein RHGRI_032897 [Rhododendron griersonianum]